QLVPWWRFFPLTYPSIRSSSCSSHPPRAVRLVFGQGKAECTVFPQSRLPVHSQIECAAADPAGRSTHPEPSRPERSGPWGLAACAVPLEALVLRSEEHTSELLSLAYLVCRLLLEKKKKKKNKI